MGLQLHPASSQAATAVGLELSGWQPASLAPLASSLAAEDGAVMLLHSSDMDSMKLVIP